MCNFHIYYNNHFNSLLTFSTSTPKIAIPQNPYHSVYDPRNGPPNLTLFRLVRLVWAHPGSSNSSSGLVWDHPGSSGLVRACPGSLRPGLGPQAGRRASSGLAPTLRRLTRPTKKLVKKCSSSSSSSLSSPLILST